MSHTHSHSGTAGIGTLPYFLLLTGAHFSGTQYRSTDIACGMGEWGMEKVLRRMGDRVHCTLCTAIVTTAEQRWRSGLRGACTNDCMHYNNCK